MVLYPGGRGPGFNTDGLLPVPTFYVDDSSCDIGGKRHTLLGAITFENERLAIAEILRCKTALGLRPNDEIKWNSRRYSRDQREQISQAILPVLARSTACVVIDEGRKQQAAVHLAKQLSDYSASVGAAGFACRFDRDILSSKKEFAAAAYNLDPPCAGWAELDSKDDQLLQCADLFAGFQKLRIDIGTGVVRPEKLVQVEVYEGEQGEYPLSWYLAVSLRYTLWGRKEGDQDFPTKVNLGRGLRVYSSVAETEMKKALHFLSHEYMGCIH